MQWKVSQVGVAGKQRHTVGDWVAVLAVSCLSRESKFFFKKWQRLDNREFFVQTIRSNGNKSAMFLCPLKSFVMLVQYPGLWVADPLHVNMQSLLRHLTAIYPHLYMSTHCVAMSSNCFSVGGLAGFQGLGLGKLVFAI